MTPVELRNEQSISSRVSILTRLVPALSYAIPMFGAALSAILLMGVMRAMTMAESAGVAAVAGGMAEADLFTLVALYFAIFVGVIGILVMVIRSLMSTTTTSPSGWFFLITAGLGLIPLLLLWEAQSLLVQAIAGREGVAQVAPKIQLCITLTLVTTVVFALVLLIASLAPLPSVLRAKRKYAPLLVLLFMELALIGTAVAFQVRASWLNQVKETGRLF